MASEKDFETKVKAYAKSVGCWVLKTWSNGVQRQGIPDLLICCNGIFIGVELKAEDGKPSDLQIWNIHQIRSAGGIGIVLYPDRFDDFKRMLYDLMVDEDNQYDWFCRQKAIFDERWNKDDTV